MSDPKKPRDVPTSRPNQNNRTGLVREIGRISNESYSSSKHEPTKNSITPKVAAPDNPPRPKK